MSRSKILFLCVLGFYLLFGWIENGWWTLLIAPLMAISVWIALVFLPLAHKAIFGDYFFVIKKAPTHPSNSIKDDK